MEETLYRELRRLAHHYMRGERPGHLLQATALVNEAYLRLASLDRTAWRDRTHFVAAAAAEMRRVLVDAARSRNRQKRGGGLHLTSIDGKDLTGPEPGVDVEALDEALGALAQFDAQLARIVELRYFGGLTLEETADALAISPATAGRGWTAARAWLRDYLDTPRPAGT